MSSWNYNKQAFAQIVLTVAVAGRRTRSEFKLQLVGALDLPLI